MTFSRMKRFFFVLAQLIWGLPQTLLGAILFLIHIRKPHRLYHGAVCTAWGRRGGLSLGLFLFAADDPGITVHEYGHAVQSLIWGPLYLPVVGLPSLLWANLSPCKRRRAKGRSYYSVWPETQANLLGRRFTGELPPGWTGEKPH